MTLRTEGAPQGQRDAPRPPQRRHPYPAPFRRRDGGDPAVTIEIVGADSEINYGVEGFGFQSS